MAENTLPPSVAAILRTHGLQPKKNLGQNFLADRTALARIVSAAELAPADTVVEVGAGLGTLTWLLAEQAGRVVAVELDRQLVAILREQQDKLCDRLAATVEIVHGDILQMSELNLIHGGYKVVANLPYYITSAVLRHFLEKPPRPERMVLTVQREVADRIVAKPGKMSLLAVSVQFYGIPRIVTRIPAGAFYPPPKVDSAVLRIDIGEQPVVSLPSGVNETDYFRIARAGFGQKRKTLRNSLSAGLGLSHSSVESALRSAGVDARRRAETLDLEEWSRLAQALTGAAA